MLQYAFMQRALLVAVFAGLAAPAVGVPLVQRRLSLIGDGLGHVALTGVALGLLTSRSPVLTALVCTVLGAVAIELIRHLAGTGSDTALAILFYGGIAGGVVIISQAPEATPGTLTTFLFGSITTTRADDVGTFAVLTVVVLVVTLGLRRHLFAVSYDEEYARAIGLPVLATNVILAVLTAITVVTSMRVVGLLLISALMVIPVATAELLANSFHSTVALSMAVGAAVSASGVWLSYQSDTPTGGTIVLTAIAVFLAAALVDVVRRSAQPGLRRGSPGPGGRRQGGRRSPWPAPSIRGARRGR